MGGTLAGALLGERLPDLAPLGLDYALPGIFVGLFADTRPKLIAGIAALAIAGALALAGVLHLGAPADLRAQYLIAAIRAAATLLWRRSFYLPLLAGAATLALLRWLA